ncbi:hypothetical protein Tco_0007011 [Tanacetum coccineum]
MLAVWRSMYMALIHYTDSIRVLSTFSIQRYIEKKGSYERRRRDSIILVKTKNNRTNLQEKQDLLMLLIRSLEKALEKEKWPNKAKHEASRIEARVCFRKDLTVEDSTKRMVDEVKAEFEKLVKQLDTYVLINFEATKESLKRFGEELQLKHSKEAKVDKIKTQPTEEKIEEDKDDKPTKKTRKRRKQIARKGFHTDHDRDESKDSDEANEKDDSTSGTKISIDLVPVATKSPSVANYKIIKSRLNGITRFMYIGLNLEYMDVYLLIQRMYPLSAEENYLNLESADVYMLIERKYPLSAEVCKAMLDKKLQGGKPDKDCYKLLKMMEKQVGIRK